MCYLLQATDFWPEGSFDCTALETLGAQILDQVAQEAGLKSWQTDHDNAVQLVDSAQHKLADARECRRLYYQDPDDDKVYEEMLEQMLKGAQDGLADKKALLESVLQRHQPAQTKVTAARSELIDLLKAEQTAMGLF